MTSDDSLLIQQCVRGDRAAFGELVLRYQDRLYNSVFRVLGNGDDARDIVQDAFLSAYQSLACFKGDARFFTWLYRIAVNLAISYKRKHRAVLVADYSRDSGGLAEPYDDSVDSQPGEALDRAEDEQRLQDALNRLSPEHRIILVLKEIEGQKYEEISEILQVPIGTVRSRLHRARLELRDSLTRNGTNPE